MSDQTIVAEAGTEPAWQVLEDINPATAEFPALSRVGEIAFDRAADARVFERPAGQVD